jgi:hypothetical protein
VQSCQFPHFHERAGLQDEIPTVGRKYVDYAYPMTFESPYMRSAYKSGKVELQFGGERLSQNFTGTASHGNKL